MYIPAPIGASEVVDVLGGIMPTRVFVRPPVMTHVLVLLWFELSDLYTYIHARESVERGGEMPAAVGWLTPI